MNPASISEDHFSHIDVLCVSGKARMVVKWRVSDLSQAETCHSAEGKLMVLYSWFQKYSPEQPAESVQCGRLSDFSTSWHRYGPQTRSRWRAKEGSFQPIRARCCSHPPEMTLWILYSNNSNNGLDKPGDFVGYGGIMWMYEQGRPVPCARTED